MTDIRPKAFFIVRKTRANHDIITMSYLFSISVSDNE